MSDESVYVSTVALETSGGTPPRWHAEHCHQVDRMDDVTEMSLTEAKEECERQANCCSNIPTLDDEVTP